MFIEKLNRSQTGFYVIEEEKTLVDGVWEGFLDHDNVNHDTLAIYTGSKLTGDKVLNYFLSTPSETPWKTHLKLFSASPSVFVVYDSLGDQVEAEDINELQDALVTEIDRSVTKDDYLDTKIEVETSRATSKENSLETNLNAEISRATSKENTIIQNLSTEVTRATGREDAIETNLNNYKASNNVEVTSLKTRATNLETRATNLESIKADKATTYTKTETDSRIQAVVSAAPAALDTLQEIAASLNNDSNFAGTMVTELSKKVDKVTGKQLSTEDYTTAEKAKLAGIETGANNYTHPATHSIDMITESTTKKVMTSAERTKLSGISASAKKVENSLANGNIKIDGIETVVYTHPAGTNPHGTSKADVGLGNVSDVLQASKAEFDTHNTDSMKHVNSAERTAWNNKLDGSANAVSASKLQTARSIALAGDVTGSVAFDGSANVSITATVADDSHNHIIANVDGLQTALNGKSPTTHTHDDRYYTESEADVKFATKTEIGQAGYGDMMKSVYDPDGDGKVGSAVNADAVPWTGVSGKPSTFAPSTHSHDKLSVADNRSVVSMPLDYMSDRGMQSEFKYRTAVDGPPTRACASSTYCHVLTIAGWSNSTGGYPAQITFGPSSIAVRVGVSDTTWGSWKEYRTVTGGLTWNDLKGV